MAKALWRMRNAVSVSRTAPVRLRARIQIGDVAGRGVFTADAFAEIIGDDVMEPRPARFFTFGDWRRMSGSWPS